MADARLVHDNAMSEVLYRQLGSDADLRVADLICATLYDVVKKAKREGSRIDWPTLLLQVRARPEFGGSLRVAVEVNATADANPFAALTRALADGQKKEGQ